MTTIALEPAPVRRDALDRVFLVGIGIKGLDGLLELVAGLALLLAPTAVVGLVTRLLNGSLATVVPGWLTRRLTTDLDQLSATTWWLAAAYLLAHGVIKVVLVAALLRDRLWAYPWMIAALIGFIGFQTFELIRAPSAGLAGLTAFDLAMVVLTSREYRRHRADAPRTLRGGD